MAGLIFTLIGDETVACKAEELPFTEEGILKGCIKFFDDEHPCFIHRAAVKARFATEMEQYFLGHCCTFPAEFDIASLPPELAEIINVKNIKRIKISNKEDLT